MRYISFMTENCKATAQKHSLSNEVDMLFKKIEDDQTIQTWDNFLPTPFIKKDLGKSYRLICARHPLPEKETMIISFIACFPRGGSGEYEKFIRNPEQVCGKFLPEPESLKVYISSREKDNLPEPSPKPSSSESEFLYDMLRQSSSPDMIVYESQEWVDTMKRSNMLDMSSRIYDLLYNLVNGEISNEKNITENSGAGISLYYNYLHSHQALFLVVPFSRVDKEKAKSINDRYQFMSEKDTLSTEEILRHSRRSYPSFILADETIWKSIEKNDAGNIALSPEESKILEDVGSSGADKVFPLFINGRPGSGKSTILQYLFASYLCMYLRKGTEDRLPYPPLYLTYSDKLLESAKKTIKDIMICNSDLALHEINLDSKANRTVQSKCFGIFHNFLLELLPSKSQARFNSAQKIIFPKFRDLWDERRKKDPRYEIRQLTPELVWHVIRSYIKGMRYDNQSDFTPESYFDLPMAQQTVQKETFELIYQDVWMKWYRPLCEQGDYWDDQDLVFAVLNEPGIDLERYPAIFCDEAQDFSKLELNLILRLSLYTRRTLQSHELKLVPFCFAGDPFQTLNPTGFEWESLQANFHEKIITGLDKSFTGKLSFNYQELSYNYRSGKFIVGLCNLLQLLRGILFDERDLKPQQTWFDTDSSMPVFFNVKDPLCESKLREQTELVIILPCQEGEEEEYVEGDPFLKGLAASEVDIRNFLSPMRAKGLEFSRVVLYNFGKACFKDYPGLFNPLSTEQAHSANLDESLPLKYFMNRLYVAASRAKNRLILVDDDDGITTLWDNGNLKSLDSLLKRYLPSSRYGWSADNLNYTQKGMEDNWTQDRDDPLSLAVSFHEAGLMEKDPYKLRLAEANYNRSGQLANARLCKAERLEMENQLSKAGELYLELDRTKRALDCYWRAEAFNRIVDCGRFSNTPEHRAASFSIGEKSEIESRRFLEFLQQQMQGQDRVKISWDPLWKKVLDQALSAVLDFLDKDGAHQLYFQLIELEKNGLSLPDKCKYAMVAYIAGEYRHALSLWESADANPALRKEYCAAKAFETPYPASLDWLERIKDYPRIISEWKKNPKIQIDDKAVAVVMTALLEADDYKSATELLRSHPAEECLRKAYETVSRKGLTKYQEQIGQSWIKKLAEKGQWKEIVDIINDKKLTHKTMNIFAATLAVKVAQSRDFQQTTMENKNAVAILLKKLFIDGRWEGVVPMRVAGASIEKAYKIIDALEFYEGVWKRERIPAEKKDIEYATARWIKSKLRLAEFLEAEGKSAGAGKHREEAENICRARLGINKDNIPEEPEFEFYDPEIDIADADADISAVSREIQEAILDLHKMGRSTQDLARIFSFESNVIEQVIRQGSSS